MSWTPRSPALTPPTPHRPALAARIPGTAGRRLRIPSFGPGTPGGGGHTAPRTPGTEPRRAAPAGPPEPAVQSAAAVAGRGWVWGLGLPSGAGRAAEGAGCAARGTGPAVPPAVAPAEGATSDPGVTISHAAAFHRRRKKWGARPGRRTRTAGRAGRRLRSRTLVYAPRAPTL